MKSIRMMVMGTLGVALVLTVYASQTQGQKKSRMQDAARHSSAAAKTFTEIMNVRDKAIPKELLDKAEAIAVFPGVIKAAFIFGGRGGQGVISRRVKGGWSRSGLLQSKWRQFWGANWGAEDRLCVADHE